MQRTMSGKKRTAVYHDNLPVREYFLKTHADHLIKRRACTRQQNASVYNEEIGI